MTGTLEHLDPASVLVGENVRDTADLDPRFIASIREHGCAATPHRDPHRRRHRSP